MSGVRYIKTKLPPSKVKYYIIISQDEEGKYVAECANVPGCVSAAPTREEAVDKVKVAVEVQLERIKRRLPPR